MDYKITHTTVYTYTEAVPICHNEVHLTPREHPRQARLASRLGVRPQPAAIDTQLDYFGNHVSYFAIELGHERLTVTASSRVRVTEAAPPLPLATPWEAIRDRLAEDRSAPFLEACQFAFDSPHVATSRELAAYAAASFTPGRPWLEALLDLTRRIHTEFRYDQSATNVSTPLDEVLRLRRGVCQDFAHLQIGCLRSLGLAGAICQWLPRHVSSAGSAAAHRGRRLACLVLGLLARLRLDRCRSDERPDSLDQAHHTRLGSRLQ